ncbi:MAG: N-acetylmuramoyl-L-alanine amidase [Lachnospirales bacterium]
MKIFLDPGHGGNNPGAVGPNGLREADVNLDVALRTGRLLQSNGYTVKYSRTSDKTVSLSERAAMANEWGADYFVSIHCNSNENPIYTGTETFYYREGTKAERFANDVNNALVAEIGTKNLGIFTANFAVLRLTVMPAILVELAFISNPEEAEQLATPSFRESCAVGITNGIIEYTS